MAVRLIFVDLDGTLLANDHRTVPAENLAAIRRAAKAGIQVVPATGRILARLPQAVREIPQIQYAIVVNGARVVELAAGRVLYEACLDAAVALEIFRQAQSLGLTPEVYQDGHMLIEPQDLQLLAARPVERDHLEHLLQREKPVADLTAHLRACPGGITKINLPYFEDLALRDRLRTQWEGRGLQLSSSMGPNLELNAPGATKGLAAKALCRAMGVPLEEAMAIGDGDNDRELLAAVGWPVAMGNAPDALKRAARLVTGTNEEAGVAQAIAAAMRRE